MALDRSEDVAYFADNLVAFLEWAPESLRGEALALLARCRGYRARAESGVRFAAVSASEVAPTPYVVRAVEPHGRFTYVLVERGTLRWERLRGNILPALLDQVVRADGLAVPMVKIEVLGAPTRAHLGMRYVRQINDKLFAMGDGCLIEVDGLAPLNPGEKLRNKRPEARTLQFRPHLHPEILEMRVETLDYIEAQVEERLGRPTTKPRRLR